MIRVAAVGDVHVGTDCTRVLGDPDELRAHADLLLLAGDLTRIGHPGEAEILADELRELRDVPRIAVLGNHDMESDRDTEIVELLADAGVIVLECASTVVEVDGISVGVAGTIGFGGGFQGASGSEFGEPVMKAFMRRTKDLSHALSEHLSRLDTEVRIALTHYSPIAETLQGERLEIFPFLGSYLLAEAVDCGGADLALHGHAHRGTEHGTTPAGVPVRNVAQPVLRRPFAVYRLQPRC